MNRQAAHSTSRIARRLRVGRRGPRRPSWWALALTALALGAGRRGPRRPSWWALALTALALGAASCASAPGRPSTGIEPPSGAGKSGVAPADSTAGAGTLRAARSDSATRAVTSLGALVDSTQRAAAPPGAAEGTPGAVPTPGAASRPTTAASQPLEAPPSATRPAESPSPIFNEEEGWTLRAQKMLGQEDAAGTRHILLDVILTQGNALITAPRGYYYPSTSFTAMGGGVRLKDTTLVVQADSATYARRTQILEAYENVVVSDRDLKMSGQAGTYDRRSERLTLRGFVRGEQEGRSFRGDELVYDRRAGRVDVVRRAAIDDPDHNFEVTGKQLTYDVNSKVAVVTAGPRLDWKRGRNAVVVEGDRMRFLDDGNRFEVVGRVVARQGRQTATADSAVFFDRQSVGYLFGSPRVTDPEGDLTGKELTLHFNENSMETAVMRGNGVVVYVPTDPDLKGERSVVRGDSLTIVFKDDQISELRAQGSPGVEYRPSLADSAAGTGRVAARADTVAVLLKDQTVDRVELTGKASGQYLYWSPARPDSLDRVDYQADRINFMIPEKFIQLRGNAQTDYHELTLKDDRIDFNAVTEMLEASPKPVLIDKTKPADQAVVGRRVSYDLTSTRGTIYHGRTQYEQGFIFADSLRKVNEAEFDANEGSYTTCDLVGADLEPHYHFTSRRMKIYLGNKVVAKPVTLYIGNIPIFRLPFYVFSLRKGRHSGLLLPQFDFGFSSTGGRFFRNLGYYWAANDYTDYTFSTSYRENPGVFIGNLNFRYAKRSLLDGQLNLGRSWGGGRSLSQVQIRHNQTLGESARLTASGDFADPEFGILNGIGMPVGQRVDRQLRSTAGLTKAWRNRGISLSLRASQTKALDANLLDSVDEVVLDRTFPDMSVSLSPRTLGHARSGERSAFLPWASSLTYSLSFSGSRREVHREVVTRKLVPDTTVTPPVNQLQIVSARIDKPVTTSGRWQFGLSDNRRVLGFLNVTPSFNLTENWVDREFSAADTVKGFHRAAVYSLSLGTGTTAYGTFFPHIGPLVALRHTVSPQVSLIYNPEFRNLTYSDTLGRRLNRFPGVGAVESKSLSYSVRNDFQAKVKSGDDLKRVALLSWTLNGTYDFLARKQGRLPASNISSGVDINRVKNVGLNFRSVHNPYHQLRFESFSLQSSVSFSGALPGSASEATAAGGGSRPDTPADLGAAAVSGLDAAPVVPDQAEPSGSGSGALPWHANFGLSWGGSRLAGRGLDKQASLTTGFDVKLSRNWAMRYSNLYSFETHEFNYQRLELSRDLHCWEAQFTYSAFPQTTEFYFRISVKALPDIKFEKGPGLGAMDSIGRLTPGGGGLGGF